MDSSTLQTSLMTGMDDWCSVGVSLQSSIQRGRSNLNRLSNGAHARMDSYRKMYNETKATSEEATHKVTIELTTFFLFLLLVMLGSASLNQLQF